MKKEPPDKFSGLQRHDLLTVPVGIISPEERNLAVLDREDAVIADGDSMGISAEVLKDPLDAIEGRFTVDDPLLVVEMSPERFEGSGFLEMAFNDRFRWFRPKKSSSRCFMLWKINLDFGAMRYRGVSESF